MEQRGYKDLQTISLFVVLTVLTIGAVLIIKLVLFAPTQEAVREPAKTENAANPTPTVNY
jgi:flagellar basal body-associated protein FliL